MCGGGGTQNICLTFIQYSTNVEDVRSTLYKCYTHFLCLQGIHLQHRLSDQRLADSINMWPNAVGTLNRPLGIQKNCLGFRWIHRNVDKKYFKEFENYEKNKNVICGIH